MSIPEVTFPLEKEQVSGKATSLTKHIRALESELILTRSLLKEVRAWCEHHENFSKMKPNTTCPVCGERFTSYDD